MDPLAVFTLHDALCAQDLSAFREVAQTLKRGADLLLCEFMRRLYAEFIKDLIRVVVAVMVMAMIVVVMVPVFFVAMIVVVVVPVFFVVMIVVVMVPVLLVAMIVVVMVPVLLVVMVMIVIMLVLVIMMIVVMVMIVLMGVMLGLVRVGFLPQLIQLRGQRLLLFHGRQDVLAGDFVPGRRHDGCFRIQLPQLLDAVIHLLVG